jgi:hypothetical protein
MASRSKPGSAAERPLWVVAFLLLGIVLCLLFFVFQTLLPDQSGRPGSPSELSKLSMGKGDSSTRQSPPERMAKMPVATSLTPELTPDNAPQRLEVPPAPLVASAATSTTIIAAGSGGKAPTGYLGRTNFHTTITGTVRLHGTPPAEQSLDVADARQCRGIESKPLTTRFFVLSTNGALADVLVFIREGLPSHSRFEPPPPRTLDFTNCQIEPHLTPISHRQSLLARSRDGLSHILRMAPDQGREALARVVPAVSVGILVPSSPEMFIPCQCQLHPWEFAYVSVLNHPFFAVTGPDGAFTITNLPPGTYVLEALHRDPFGTNGLTRQIKVKSGETARANFLLEAPAPQTALSL